MSWVGAAGVEKWGDVATSQAESLCIPLCPFAIAALSLAMTMRVRFLKTLQILYRLRDLFGVVRAFVLNKIMTDAYGFGGF